MKFLLKNNTTPSAVEFYLNIVTVLSKINTSVIYLARDRRRSFTNPAVNLQKPLPEIVSRICSSGQSKSIDEINDSRSRSVLALFHAGQIFSSAVIKIMLMQKKLKPIIALHFVVTNIFIAILNIS